MYEESRKNLATKRKKESDKETREKKKKWVESGCGHGNLKDMFKCTHSHLNLSDRSVPVTTEKKNLKEGSESVNASEDELDSSDELSPEYRLKQIPEYNFNQIALADPMSPVKESISQKHHSPMSMSSSSSSTVQVTKVVSAKSVTSTKVTESLDVKKTDVKLEKVSSTTDVEVDTESNVADEDAVSKQDQDHKFVCSACGNNSEECHQYVYRSWLVQETISFMNEKELDEISINDVRHNMKYAYNKQLNFGCYRESQKYDWDCWYEFPECLEKGGVEFAVKVFHNKQILFHLKNRREGGIAKKTMFNRGIRVYDYSDFL